MVKIGEITLENDEEANGTQKRLERCEPLISDNESLYTITMHIEKRERQVKEDMKEKAELLKDATPYEEKKEDAPKGFGMLRRDSLGELDDKLAAPKGINVSLTRANAVAKKPDPNLIAFD